MSDTKIKLYGFPLSGHAHRIQLALSLMGIPFDLEQVNLAKGEQRSDWFKKLNPAGKVPVLVDGDNVISDSTAILTYLAKKFDDGTWFPESAVEAADVEKWFVSASTLLAQGPAAARLINLFGAAYDKVETVQKANDYLSFLDNALEGKSYLVADRPTFADVAIYSYVAHAPEGHVSLAPYKNVTGWLARIEALDGFVPMQKTEVAAAA